MDAACRSHTKNDGSWWENDGRGIPLCRVCDKCADEKLAKFRPEIVNRFYTENDVDEQIEAEG